MATGRVESYTIIAQVEMNLTLIEGNSRLKLSGLCLTSHISEDCLSDSQQILFPFRRQFWLMT